LPVVLVQVGELLPAVAGGICRLRLWRDDDTVPACEDVPVGGHKTK
jgi:hypothetical protein